MRFSAAAKFNSSVLLLALFLAGTVRAQRTEGPYTKALSELASAKLHPLGEPGVILKCLSSPSDSLLIGAFHQIPIHAPVAEVYKVFRNFEAYPEWLPGVKSVKILRTEPSFLVSFEQIIPFPFVPNTRYSVWYESLRPAADSILIRFQLSASEDLKSLDGYSLLKGTPENETLYSELDFLDAHWGVAKFLSPRSIWKEAVSGFLESDFALKLKSEKPAMSTRELQREARFSVEAPLIEQCVKGKVDASSFLKNLN